MNPKIYKSLGLMTGTSIDGIDAALIETDGVGYVKPLGFMPNPYDADFRARLRRMLGRRKGRADPDVAVMERDLTDRHAAIVTAFLKQLNLQPADIDLIGFHGQTIWHQPAQKLTIQLGDGARLAQLTGIPIVNDFRSNDVKAGGNGAPLVPLYHRALAAALPKPVVILNIGGVSNITWLGGEGDGEILACDVGPGNAMLDDWVLRHTKQPYDADGKLAAAGKPWDNVVKPMLNLPFFKQRPPKSLDRDAFNLAIEPLMQNLTPADGAATLTAITARGVAAALPFLPRLPERLYVTGGGRLNLTLMKWIAEATKLDIRKVDELGWSGDGLEAEAFAYLAVRSVLGLPLSLPRTTGVPRAMVGGKLWRP